LISTYAKDAVTVTPKGTLGGDGRRTFDGTAVLTKAWVVDKSGVLRTVEGREIVYNRVIYLRPEITIAAGDRITFDSKDHEVLEARRVDDVNNVTQHIKCMMK
jgi:hypothetical protein